MTDHSQIFALHRYFLSASTMRRDMQKYLREHPGSGEFESAEFVQFFVYMSLWYSTLWVALEGWQELGVEDPGMDQILNDGRAARLKRFRNATFHFQKEYYDDRLVEYMSAEESVAWTYMAHHRLGNAILRELGEPSWGYIVTEEDK